MSLQQLNTSQVKGVASATLTGDLIDIVDKAVTYDRPVATTEDLPMVGNQDGDLRLVLDIDSFYTWDEPTQQWLTKRDKSTEARAVDVTIINDNQVSFTTELLVGVEGGIASLGTIRISINGILQAKQDYTLGVTGQVPPRLIISWESTDFPLETTDTLTVEHDILIIE